MTDGGEPRSVRPHLIIVGDVFERHGHTWTVEHVIRAWGGSVHVMCAGGGMVWLPAGVEVEVRRGP